MQALGWLNVWALGSGLLSTRFKWGFPKIRGTILGGYYNKDYSILGSILGSPYFGKLPNGVSGFQGLGEN